MCQKPFPVSLERMQKRNRTVVVLVAVAIALTGLTGRARDLHADTRGSAGDGIGLKLLAESGFLGVVDHRIRFDDDDRSFLYHKEGGQDVLFPFTRFSLELEIAERHTVIFLYQPLVLETRVDMPEPLSVGGEPFSGESLRLLYSFPFYRLSYLREIVGGPRLQVAAGASLQIRNANIEFEAQGRDEPNTSAQGFYRSAGIGPVPLLKVRARYELPRNFWFGAEIDGIYAPVSYINGSDNDTVGALLDASIRAGYSVTPVADLFINTRYLGGGASNTDPDDYSVNWLNVVSLTLGAALEIR